MKCNHRILRKHKKYKRLVFKFKFIYSHFFNCNTTTIREKKVKTELIIHSIKYNKGKKCVAAKGDKLSSWLLTQSGYKKVELIQ